MENNKNTGAGKGDKPRNCFSEQYRENYDSIKWDSKKYLIDSDNDNKEINETNPHVVKNNF